MEKGKPKYPENNGENKQQTQPTYGVHARIWWKKFCIISSDILIEIKTTRSSYSSSCYTYTIQVSIKF